MATARLDDNEKSRIGTGIGTIIGRALHNKQFPLEKEDVFDWILGQIPESHEKAYRLLESEHPELVKKQSYGCDFKILSTTHSYQIGVTSEVPYNHILINPFDPRHAAVLEWAEWWFGVKEQVGEGCNYVEELVWACTSVGQLKRLLPPEILRFVPSHLLDFSEVIRRSRIPASFTPDAVKMEAMMKILTLGAISPEQRKGMNAWVEQANEIAQPE